MQLRVLGRRLAATASAAVAIAGIALVTAGPAEAVTDDTVTFSTVYPGKAISYNGGDHANSVTVTINTGDTGTIVFQDPNAVNLSTNSPCTLTNSTTVTCPKSDGSTDADKVYNVTVVGNGGDDSLTAGGFGMVKGSTFRPIKVTLSGFAGNDTLTANGGFSGLVGGAGNDTLKSGPGTSTDPQFRDVVDGGDGDDVIDTWSNSTDVDGIYCDTSNYSLYYNTLDRDSGDVKYHTNPPDCDVDNVH
jgi:Ca2+-binding RTX toxin-like protein